MAAPVVVYPQASVLTWHNDNFRTGQNLQEMVLTPSNVSSATFGKLFTVTVDGKVDAEPLYVPSLLIPTKGIHNVLFVVTEHASVYAFDADTGGTPLWQVSLLAAGETPSDNRGCGQVSPEIGITSTPVIDPQKGPNGTIYVVAMSKAGTVYHHRVHALDLTTGAEVLGGPVEVQATYPGNGSGSSAGVLTFDPKQYKERAALLLSNGTLYTSWASHCDFVPYTAWVIGYNATNLSRVSVLNLVPNGTGGAIWAAGAGPAADANGNIYLLTGNGTFDTTLTAGEFPVNGDYGNAIVKIATGGTSVADYFTMNNTVAESNADQDLGSGGGILLPTLNDAQGNPRDLAIGAGKDGSIYVVDRANMGKFHAASNTIYQQLAAAVGSVFSTPAWFNGTLYYGGSGDALKAFGFSNGAFATTPTSRTALSFPYPGTTPSISANGNSNGIVWAVENSGTAVLHAYNASNLATELYNTNLAAANRDHFGAGNKYIVPMVVNGKVYVGTTTGVAAFGLLCGGASIPVPANNATGIATNSALSWTAGAGATSYDIALSTTNPPGIVSSGLTGTSYTPSSLTPGTTYYWFIVTHHCGGATQSATFSFTTAGGGNQPPSTVSVAPSAGSGASQSFGFVFSDANGYADIPWVQMLFNATLTGSAGCYTHYDRASNMLLLLNDAANGWLGPVTLGTSNNLQNSQCTVNAMSSSASGAGNNLTVNLALTFNASFGGTKNIYMQTVDNAGAMAVWQQRGTWTPFSNQAPSAVSVTPSSGSGSTQTFTLLYSDPNGASDLAWGQMIINTSLSGSAACYTHYDRASNMLLLLNDAANAWLGPVTLGSAASLQNSQCTVNAMASSASAAGNNLSINLAITFSAAFGGAKRIYMQAMDNGGQAAPWQQRGTWTPFSNQTPLAVSVTPSTGTGSSQTFAFLYSDPNGAPDLAWTQIIVNSSLSGSGACYAHYDRASNAVLLLNDAANAWLGPVTLGTANTLQNSRCSLNAMSSSAAGVGNNLTVNLVLTFTPAFAGVKNVYMQAQDNGGLATGWQLRGTWTAQ